MSHLTHRVIAVVACISIILSSVSVSVAAPQSIPASVPAQLAQSSATEKSASYVLRGLSDNADDVDALLQRQDMRPSSAVPRSLTPGQGSVRPRRGQQRSPDPLSRLPDFALVQANGDTPADPVESLNPIARADYGQSAYQAPALTAPTLPSTLGAQTTQPTPAQARSAAQQNPVSGYKSVVYLPVVMADDGKSVLVTPEEGGVLDLKQGLAIAFAPGAVNTPARARYDNVMPRNLPSGLRQVGSAFDLSVRQQANGLPLVYFPPEVVTSTVYAPEFNSWQVIYNVTPTVRVSLSYQTADIVGLQENRLRLYWQDPATGAWKVMPSGVNEAHKLVWATLERNGRYALLGQPIVNIAALSQSRMMSPSRVLTVTRVVIDPDHGGSDPGGQVFSPAEFAVREKDRNLAGALLLRDKLQACNVQVDMTRETDVSVGTPHGRAGIINSASPNLAVTFAFNVAGQGMMQHFPGGPMGLVDFDKPGDIAFATAINAEVANYTGLTNHRGVRNADTWAYCQGNCVGSWVPGVLYAQSELAFLDSDIDRKFIDEHPEAFANAVFAAIIKQSGGSDVCPPDFQFPEPLSPEERARLRNLAYQDYMRYRGDPANTSTGNHVQQFVDVQAPGVGGFDFALSRTYNALDTRDGLFGMNWSSVLDSYLRLARDGSVDARLPDGSGVYFVADGNGGFQPGQEGVFHTLARNGSEFTLSTPDQVFYHYEVISPTALLTQIRDRHDNAIAFERGADGLVTTVTDTAGRRFTLAYNGKHIASITDPLGRVIRYGYDGEGNLVSVTDARGGVRRFEYENYLLTKLTDAEGILYLQNIYDDQGRVVEQIDASGKHSYFDFGAEGQTTFTDNLDNQTVDKYDDLGRVTETTDALGHTEHFAYDAQYNVTSYTDRRDNTWTYTYDARGNRLTEADPQGHTITYTYNDTNDLTSITDEGGADGSARTTTYVYDGDGNLVRIERPDGAAIRSTYDSHGQMVTLTNPRNRTTTFVYDAQGNLIQVADPLTNATRYGYDVMGRQISMTDANNHTARFGYDANDNVVQITDPKVRAVTFVYDDNDLLMRMVDRRGGVTTYEYDENLKLISETDPLGHTTTYSYDAMYNRIRMTDPRGGETLYRYNANYWLIEVEDALGGITRFEYDPNGNLIRVTDALDHATSFEYDSLNRLVKQTGALSNITRYEYDAVGRRTAMTNPRGAVTHYVYDVLNRLIRVLDALGGEWLTTYDANGNIIGLTDANGHTTTMIYDAADRLTGRTDAGGHSTRFTYDGVGNRLTVTDALSRVTRYAYDENDNLATTTDALNGVTRLAYDAEDQPVAVTDANNHTTGFAYNLDGQLITLTEAGGQVSHYEYDAAHNLIRFTNAKGNAWTYAYDALNRRITETDPLGHATRYAYDKLGQRIRVTDANGIQTRYDYDALGRLAAVVQNEQTSLPADYQTNVTTRYAYDAVDNLTAITDANGETTTFAYDLLDRLTGEVNPLGHVWQYEYDPAGNLTQRTDAESQVTGYTYDADDLLTAIGYPDNSSITFAYDAVHNQTAMTDTLGLTRNEYDALNRLVASVNHVGQWVRSTYDPVGNRTSLIYPDGKVVHYEYDSTNYAQRVIDPDGNTFSVTRDATHNIARIDNPNQTRAEYDVDAAERLTAVRNVPTQTLHETISSFAYTLDPVGNRTRIEGVYRWRKPTQLNVDYAYDPLYRLTRSADSDGHFTDYTFDAAGNRLRRVTNDDPTLVREIDVVTTTYSYDAANELNASIREVTPRSPSADRALQTAQILRAFAHEVQAQSGKHIQAATAGALSAQANELIADLESDAPPTVGDTATALGSLQTAVETARAQGRIDNAGVANSLLAKLRQAGEANQRRGGDVKATLYDYDLNGNRIRRTTSDIDTGNERDRLKTEYGYTFENLLAHVQNFRSPGGGSWLPGDETWQFFDGYGRMFRRRHDQHIGGGGDQSWVDYAYDGLDPIAEYENPSLQHVNYYRGLGRILNMRQNAADDAGDGTVYYYHDDGLGSVSAITKQQGQSAHNYRYDDYGTILDVNGKAADSSNFTNPHNHYAYTGQEWDEYANLFHFYAREYEPETGVWLQQDPYRGQLAIPVAFHRYGYVGGNPVNYTDMYGFDRNIPSWSMDSLWPWINLLSQYCTSLDCITDLAESQRPDLQFDGSLGSDATWVDRVSDILAKVKSGISILKILGVAEIDLRYNPWSKSMPRPTWLKTLPSSVQKQVVRLTRNILGKVPFGSKLASLGSKASKANYLLTFVISPFVELPASITMIDKRIHGADLTGSEMLMYSIAGGLDAASYGIVRGFAKIPALPVSVVSEEKAAAYEQWVDENINAGKVADLLQRGIDLAKEKAVQGWNWTRGMAGHTWDKITFWE